MTCTVFSLNDFYEIHYDAERVTAIVRYRRGENSTGELVTYENLPQRTQNDIFNRLKKALLHDRTINTPSNDPVDLLADRSESAADDT